MAKREEPAAANVEPPAADANGNPVNGIEWLVARWQENTIAFRDVAQVYRHVEGVKSSSHMPWVGDLACSLLGDARNQLARTRWGGPGKYNVLLLARDSGLRVKGMHATVEVASDLRDPTELAMATNASIGGGGQTGLQAGNNGMAGLIVALAAALKPQDRPLEQMLIAKALEDKQDTWIANQSAYNAGFDAGISRGKALAGDAWRPKDVVELAREVKELLRPGGANASQGGNPSVLSLFRVALDLAISPRAMVKIVAMFSGAGAVGGLVQNLPAIIEDAGRDPEAKELLAREGARAWLMGFAEELKQETAHV